MFHLNKYISTVLNFKFYGALVVILLFIISNSQYIAKRISGDESVSKLSNRSYFRAVLYQVDDQNALIAKLKALPNVDEILFKTPTQMKRMFSDENKDRAEFLGLEKIIEKQFIGIEVYFQKGTPRRSQILIQKILAKIVGKSNLVLSKIKYASSENIISNNKATMSLNKIQLSVIFVSVFFLSLIFKLMCREYSNELFIRKKFSGVLGNEKLESFLMLLIIGLIILALSSLALSDINIISILGLIVPVFLFPLISVKIKWQD